MKHIKNKTGGVLIYDKNDWFSGLGPQGSFSLTQYLTQVENTGFLSTDKIDPFRFYGTLCPGFASGSTSTNSSTLSGVQVAMELKDNDTGYLVDAGGKIQKLTISTNTLTNAGAFPHTITGTSPVGQDGILYRHNLGGTAPSNSTVSFFYSYYNNANWDIGTLGIISETFDDDFMSTVPASPLDISSGDGDDSTQRTAPHPMEIGADGILYVGYGRYIHAYDGNTGNNGTFYSKVLILPQGFQIVAMKKYLNTFIIVGNYYGTSSNGVGEAIMYTWDYTSADVTTVLPLEDFYVSALFLWNGSPTVITQGVQGRNGRNKVKVVSGNQVETLGDFDGTIPVNRGVVVLNDIIYLNAGGKILSIGNRFKASDAVNHVYTTSTASSSGVLIYADLITGFVASSFSGSACINTIYSNNGMGAGSAKTFFFDPELEYNKIARVMSVVVKYYDILSPAGTNGTMTMALNVDNNTTTYPIISALNSIALPLAKKYTQTTTGGKLPVFSTIGWTASWAASSGGSGSLGPIVSEVQIEYTIEELPLTI